MRTGRYGSSSRQPLLQFKALALAIPNCYRINNLRDRQNEILYTNKTFFGSSYFIHDKLILAVFFWKMILSISMIDVIWSNWIFELDNSIKILNVQLSLIQDIFLRFILRKNKMQNREFLNNSIFGPINKTLELLSY